MSRPSKSNRGMPHRLGLTMVFSAMVVNAFLTHHRPTRVFGRNARRAEESFVDQFQWKPSQGDELSQALGIQKERRRQQQVASPVERLEQTPHPPYEAPPEQLLDDESYIASTKKARKTKGKKKQQSKGKKKGPKQSPVVVAETKPSEPNEKTAVPEKKPTKGETKGDDISESVQIAVKDAMGNLVSTEVVPGVPEESIKGAALIAAATALLAGKGLAVTSVAGVTAALTAISSGSVGWFTRFVGGVTWETLQSCREMYAKADPNFQKIRQDQAEIERLEAEIKQALQDSEEALKRAEALDKEAARLEARSSDDLDEDLSLEELDQLMATTGSSLSETSMLDDVPFFQDEPIEADNVAQESPIEEQDDIPFFEDQDDEMDAIRLAQDSIDGKMVGFEESTTLFDEDEKADWDAAGRLAQSLGSETVDMDAVEEATLEAIEAFEKRQNSIMNKVVGEKPRNVEPLEDDVVYPPPLPSDADELAKLGQAARAAVDLFNDNDKEEDSTSTMGYAAMTVKELRDELSRLGLPTAGNKASLVARLEESVLQESNTVNGSVSPESILDNDALDDIVDEEDIGRAARAAVELFDSNGGLDLLNVEEPSDGDLLELEGEAEAAAAAAAAVEEASAPVDFEKMTVVQLKDELRRRKLRVGGRKAELIERLRSNS